MISINTTKHIIPMIYAYTTPEIKRHEGWTKIGYTEQDVDTRIKQQTHTADIEYKKEWQGTAIYDDGSGDTFKDTDFHKYLRKKGIEADDKKDNEWFHINGPDSRIMFMDFKADRGVLKDNASVIPYNLRSEQEQAIKKAIDYFTANESGEFLWNAKPRFGKTLAVYDLCKRINATKVLVVTNRPAIANSWYDDYCKFLGTESGYYFVSSVDALKNKKHVLNREQFTEMLKTSEEECKCIEFVSLQDLKGSKYFGGEYDKLREVADLEFSLLVIDEAHEGVDTYKTDVAFDNIKREYTLHLSGTPFKALSNDKFDKDAIYNWTYADEQKAKSEWVDSIDMPSPYKNLPKLNMFTYQMSEIIRDELKQGIDINGETEEYAFDLNEFFLTDGNGKFLHNSSVDKFLDALTTQTKFPFSTDELRNELKHTFWLLNRVDSAKALAKKLEKHPVFKDYKIILAAGDGKIDEDVENAKSFNKVVDAIKKYDKTITLSVGQLTTGVTIPEWTAVLMLSNIKSPSLYMQAAFRAQNPCLFSNGKEFFRKQNAYVFDFDPARTLIIFEEFANDLSSNTVNGKGDSETRKKNVEKLLNFFPVIGEDENGEMIELDAEKVLSIPRKLKSEEVVKRGFMCDFLFQNINNIFKAPQEVLDIITKLESSKDFSSVTTNSKTELSLNDDGEVELEEEYVIGKEKDVFGNKIYDIGEIIFTDNENDEEISKLNDSYKKEVIKPLLNAAEKVYGKDLKQSTKKELEKKTVSKATGIFNKLQSNYNIDRAKLIADTKEKLEKAPEEQHNSILVRLEQEEKRLTDTFTANVNKAAKEQAEEAKRDIVKQVETDKKERKKKSQMDVIKEHLRGFSRTIPSFLMAYSSDNDITLENFDTIVPDDVFQEVTSITLDQFRFLRDGGNYNNPETKKEEYFEGHVFEPVVFNDSVKEFIDTKNRLSNYFDETLSEDIFDYIPPQQTNQIFTPKKIISEMLFRLEKENPGCFDDDTKTFIDLYMKSGMYITEIVKRLYQSEKMKELYPNDKKRLQHIFEHQVYGLAPTEIIYKISLNYILGFADEMQIDKHNIRLCDALEYTQNGTLEEKLQDLFHNNVESIL